MTTAGQAQFRYTQTTSKVIHLRNLPWECTEEELIQLCTPFGKVINMCSVGANRNQAFVEFADLNQAITMVSYYASSSEPAQVRGKTVYIQYSNRQEIVNNKAPGDVPSNVLLVTIEGVQAGDVSIDVIHLIVTFEKAAGFQALIQYSDAGTASSASEALDGRSIPRYLLPEHVGSCNLRISYSAHKDLNIKLQSNRSRDYTNPYLPVNYTVAEGSTVSVIGPDGLKKEPESNVLLASIENMQYAVTVDVLHKVFSAFGTVQKIAIFEKNGGTQALIQFTDVATAAIAKDALEGHCIYDGGYCKLHLSYSRHTDLGIKAYSDKSRDYTIPEGLQGMHQATVVLAPSMAWPPVPMYPAGQFTSGGVVQGQATLEHVPSWGPTIPAGQGNFISVLSTFPGQLYVAPPAPAYATTAPPAAASPFAYSSHINPSVQPIPTTQHAYQPNAQPFVGYESTKASMHALSNMIHFQGYTGDVGPLLSALPLIHQHVLSRTVDTTRMISYSCGV